jgi:hypothetical protein
MELFMNRSIMVAFTLGLAPMGGVPALAVDSWDGTYVYEQSLGKNLAGDRTLFVNHVLTIKGGDCQLAADGYQTQEKIRCKATANGDKLEVLFAAKGTDSMGNPVGRAQYKPNEPLFTLTRKGTPIATGWQGYQKNDVQGQGPATFRKLAPGERVQ